MRHRGVILAYEHLKDSVEKNFDDDSNTSIKIAGSLEKFWCSVKPSRSTKLLQNEANVRS